MIQRKQTLWFLIAALIACLAFYIPFGVKNTTSIGSYNINEQNLTAKSDMIMTIMFIVIALINVVAVFLFKDRKKQVMLSLFSIILSIGALAYEIYFASTNGNKIAFGILGSMAYFGLLIPAVSLLFTFLANRGVNQDIKLLKETDRLR